MKNSRIPASAMTGPYQRRTFLQGTVASAATLALPSLMFSSQARAASEPGITQVQGPLSLIDAGGCNVLALATDDGLVLVDSGPQDSSELLMRQVRSLVPEGPYTLINTHWHEEQTGGNEALGLAGARIIAHEKTLLHLATEYYLPHEERYKRALPAPAQPTETFYTSASMSAGGETIDYAYLRQAHTDGDIYVFFRTANVLAVGDVVSPERDPVLDWYGGGWLGGRVEAMDLLLVISNEDTRIVPAFGPIMSRAQLQVERDMMAFLHDKLVEQMRMGFSAKDSLDAGVMNGLARTWNDPYRFLYDAYKGLWAHHNKLAPNIV